MHKPKEEDKLLLQGNLKEDSGHMKRECFSLKNSLKQIGVRKDKKGKDAGETNEKTQPGA